MELTYQGKMAAIFQSDLPLLLSVCFVADQHDHRWLFSQGSLQHTQITDALFHDTSIVYIVWNMNLSATCMYASGNTKQYNYAEICHYNFVRV